MCEQEILAAELAHLRARFADAMGEIRANERYALAITGAVWSWCATNDSNDFVTALWWFPTFACVLLGIRSFASYLAVRSVWSTVQRLQEALEIPETLCWERTTTLGRSRAVTFFSFWMIMQPGTFAVALLVTLGG